MLQHLILTAHTRRRPKVGHLPVILACTVGLGVPLAMAQRPSSTPATPSLPSSDTPVSEARRLLHEGTKLTEAGKLGEAEQQLLKALQAAEQSARKAPNADLFQTLDALGKFYEFKKVDYDKAKQYYARIQKIALETKAFDPDTIVPYYWSRMGAMHAKQQDFPPAIALLERSVKALAQKSNANPSVLFMTRDYLHDVYRAQGKPGKALNEAQQMVAIAERIKDPNSKRNMLIQAVCNLADDYRVANKSAEFEVQSRRAIALINNSPELKSSDMMVAQLQNLGSHFYRQKKFALAEPLLVRAESILRTRTPRDENLYAWIVGKLTLIQQARNKQVENQTKQTTPTTLGIRGIDEALSMPKEPGKRTDATLVAQEQDCRQQLAKALAKVRDPYRPDVALKIRELGDITYKQQQYKQANSLYKESLKIFESLFGPNDKEVAFTIEKQVVALRNLGENREAERLQLRANAIKTLADQPVPKIAAQPAGRSKDSTTELLRQTLAKASNPPGPVDPKLAKSAEDFRKQALLSLTKLGDPFHNEVLEPVGKLAAVWCEQRSYSEAERLFQASVKISETMYGPNHPKVGELLTGYAKLLRKTGRSTEADRLEIRASTITRRRTNDKSKTK